MADWQYKLEIKEDWDRRLNLEITTQELAEIIANKLRELDCPEDDIYDERFSIAEEFEILSNDKSPDFDDDDFNYVMDMLYDWGDIDLGFGRKVCWIGAAF